MRASRGFTYLGLLFGVAVMGLALASVAQVWVTTSKREREQELLFIGNEFRQAIGSYYESTPGAKEYPRRLADLLQDNRFPNVRRHLRKLYVDPMTGKAEWGLVVQGDQILGVYSLSRDRPLKSANFEAENAFFGGDMYADWQFVYTPYGSQSAGQAALAADQPRVPAANGNAGLAAADTNAGSDTSSPSSLASPTAVAPWVCIAARGNDVQACAELDEAAAVQCKRQALQRYRSCLARSAGNGQPFGSGLGSGNQ